VWKSSHYPAPVFVSDTAMDERTFPGPWSFDEIPQGYRVLDANRRVIAYVVARDPSGIDRSEGVNPRRGVAGCAHHFEPT
jgi:hypothetical protein